MNTETPRTDPLIILATEILKLKCDNAQLRAALVDVLLHVGGHRETDFVQPLPLTWSAAVREAKRVLPGVQA